MEEKLKEDLAVGLFRHLNTLFTWDTESQQIKTSYYEWAQMALGIIDKAGYRLVAKEGGDDTAAPPNKKQKNS